MRKQLTDDQMYRRVRLNTIAIMGFFALLGLMTERIWLTLAAVVSESPTLSLEGPSSMTLGATQAARAGDRPNAATSKAPRISHSKCRRVTT